MAPRKGKNDTAGSSAGKTSQDKLPMGYAAIQVQATEGRLKESFTTSVPNSWIYAKETDENELYVLFKQSVGEEDYTLIMDIAKKYEGKHAPGGWALLKCNRLQLFDTYKASSQYIASLVQQGFIEESHLEPYDVDEALADVPSIEVVDTTLETSQIIDTSIEDGLNHGATVSATPQDNLSVVDELSNSHDDLTSTFNTQEVREELNCTTQNIVNNSITRADLTEFSEKITTFMTGLTADSETRLTEKLDKIDSRLDSLEAKVTNVQIKHNELTKIVLKDGGLKKNEALLGFEEFCDKHKVPTPIETEELFDKFDSQIIGEVYSDLKKHLISTSNNYDKVKHTCTDIFKRFFKRAVVENFTAQRKSKLKDKKFKDTKFYVCLKDALTNVYYNPLREDGTKDSKIYNFDEKILLTQIGLVFNDAHDWEGKRADRGRTSNENEGGPTSPKKQKTTQGDKDSAVALHQNQSANIMPN